MDHGMGENSGGNGILMEDEIFDTPEPNSQPQATQAQMGASSQYDTMAQPDVSSQYAAAAQPQPAQQMAQPQKSDELAAFQSAPSFDAMDGMDMGISGAGSNGAFGESSDTTSSDWQNQNSNMAFQGSSAGENVVMYEETTSNVVLGLVGALVGALIGAALWIVIYQLGYLAGIAGAAIIGFSIKGYVILGKSIDMKGLIFCAVLSIATIYFSHRVAFTISCMGTMSEFYGSHMNFITAYTNLNKFMQTLDTASQALGMGGDSVTVAFWRDLFVGYALSAVVGIPMAKNMIARS